MNNYLISNQKYPKKIQFQILVDQEMKIYLIMVQDIGIQYPQEEDHK